MTSTRRRFLTAIVPGAIVAPLALVGHASAIPSPVSAASGLMQALEPTRILDTRQSSPVGYNSGKPTFGQTIAVNIHAGGAQPTGQLAAAMVNLTVTETDAAGYLTAWSGIPGRPATSNVNWDQVPGQPGRITSGLALVPLQSNGTFYVYTYASTHVIVDLVGVVLAYPLVA